MFQNLSLKDAGIGTIIGILSACISILAMLAFLWLIGFFPTVIEYQEILAMTTNVFIKTIVISAIIGFLGGTSSKLRKPHSWEKIFPLIFIVISVIVYWFQFSMFHIFLNSHTMSILLSRTDGHVNLAFDSAVSFFLSIYIFSCFLICQYLLYKYFLYTNSTISSDVSAIIA